MFFFVYNNFCSNANLKKLIRSCEDRNNCETFNVLAMKAQNIIAVFRILMFLGLYRIWILPSTSKQIKINHDFYCFVTSQ
jgi:hypothetical protein